MLCSKKNVFSHFHYFLTVFFGNYCEKIVKNVRKTWKHGKHGNMENNEKIVRKQ